MQCSIFSSNGVEDDDKDDDDKNNNKGSKNKFRRYVSTFVLRSGTGIPAVTLMSVSNKLVQNPLSVGRSMIKSMLFFHCYEHQ